MTASTDSSPSVARDLLAALDAAHGVLDAVAVCDEDGRQIGWLDGPEVDTDTLAELMSAVARLEGRVDGLKLHVGTLAERARAADTTGATSTGAWAAQAAGKNRHRSWTPIWLADRLQSTYHHTRAALAVGVITEEHAAIIVNAADAVPDGIDPVELAECEAKLVAKATELPPAKLRRAAKRLLEPISKRLADTHENELLGAEEERAQREAFITMGDRGDGTWTGKFCLPEMHAQMLLAALDKLSGPHRWHTRSDGKLVEDDSAGGDIHERRGRAFCEIIEHLPTDKLGPGAVSLVVHIDYDHLFSDSGAGHMDTGVRMSAGEARRLACNAGHLPLVLGGGSVPLDLGHKRRLFSPGQILALSAQYDSCAAEGCDRPFAWSEIHHLKPWGHGGPTDLANAVPLCGHHHRRIHDQYYDWQRLPDGQIRFEHRWRSRRRRSDAA